MAIPHTVSQRAAVATGLVNRAGRAIWDRDEGVVAIVRSLELQLRRDSRWCVDISPSRNQRSAFQRLHFLTLLHFRAHASLSLHVIRIVLRGERTLQPPHAASRTSTNGIRCRVNSSELVAGINKGDREIERLFVQRYGPLVRQFLKRKISCPATVDDLSQECFLVAITYLRNGRLRAPDKLTCFIFGVLRRLVLTYARSTMDLRALACDLDELVGDGFSPEETAEQEIIRALVHARLDDLKIARDRRVLAQRYLLDQDSEAIAQDLGVSQNELRTVLCRARQRLRLTFGGPSPF